MLDTDFLLKPLPFLARDYVFKLARTPGELESFWKLRSEVFCDEQGLFSGSDRDHYDQTMLPIICKSLIAGMEDRVVGAVRIDEREPQVWWGSRLCVAREIRKIEGLSPSVGIRNDLPERWHSIGAGLIYKAVTTAHARGCRRFLAMVQAGNADLFEHLHWRALDETEYLGLPHVKMEADLHYYPAAALGLAT